MLYLNHAGHSNKSTSTYLTSIFLDNRHLEVVYLKVFGAISCWVNVLTRIGTSSSLKLATTYWPHSFDILDKPEYFLLYLLLNMPGK